jgi:hypothetical protein
MAQFQLTHHFQIRFIQEARLNGQYFQIEKMRVKIVKFFLTESQSKSFVSAASVYFCRRISVLHHLFISHHAKRHPGF